ncbi:MAG: BTAD domain-containing putative transcriptional regulator [Acidimicrobiales bacterium]
MVNGDGTRSAVAGQQGDVGAVGRHAPGRGTDRRAVHEVLWGEQAPRTAATGLRVVVNRLRDRLGHVHADAIVNEAGHYRLVVDPMQIDMHQFDARVQLARGLVDGGRYDEAITQFERALALWHGESFQSTGDLGPLIGVQTRLDESRADAEERLTETLMFAGRNDDAVVTASSIMRDFELRERRWELLVLALYRAGRQAEALRAYRRAERMLAEEYGLQPGPQLAELELRILEQDATLLLDERLAQVATADAPLRLTSILDAIKSKPAVPAIASPLVGRDDDLQRVSDLLERHRLLTIVGPAGVGKTRLATQLAQGTAHGQVIWLDLLVRDPDSIIAELASQLGVGGHGGEVIEAVLRALSMAPAMLVFDNCEHVIDTIAPLAEAMVRHCPALRVVATSRVAFDSESEMSVDLAALDHDAARHLVLDRLAGFDARGTISDASLDQLVDAVDRMPLALELVASRLRNRPIEIVMRELEESLDSLSGSRHSDQRHVGLNEALDWSIALLDEAALPVYEALGVMVGPFRARDMAALLELPLDDVAQQLQALAALSLVGSAAIGDLPAYRAMQTVTVHARRRLVDQGSLGRLTERHARVYASVMRRAAVDLRGPDEEVAVATVRSATGQIRAAFQWAIDHDLDTAETLAVDLWEYSFLRLDFGLVSFAPTVVAAMERQQRTPSPELLGTAAFASWAMGLTTEGHALAARAERAATAIDAIPPIRAFQARANIASMSGDDDMAQEAIMSALKAARRRAMRAVKPTSWSGSCSGWSRWAWSMSPETSPNSVWRPPPSHRTPR